jgi:hypothetical protein
MGFSSEKDPLTPSERSQLQKENRHGKLCEEILKEVKQINSGTIFLPKRLPPDFVSSRTFDLHGQGGTPPASWISAFAAPWPQRPASGRSGLSQTVLMSGQMRALPDQRSSRAAWASS